jgi:hypothetical protein
MDDGSGGYEDSAFYQDAGNIGLGTEDPEAKFHIKQSNLKLRLEDTSAADKSFTDDPVGDSEGSVDMSGIDMQTRNMDTTYKYGSAVKFMSSDDDIGYSKFVAGIIPRATETYNGNSTGGMALDFCVSDTGDSIPSVEMTIDHDGEVGIGTNSPEYTLDVEGSFRATAGLIVDNNATIPNIIMGSSSNTVESGFYGNMIGGGGNSTYPNTIDDVSRSVILGGEDNAISGSANYGAILGGESNSITSSYAVAGGSSNTVSNTYSAAIGSSNSVSSYGSTAIGYDNNVSGTYSTALGKNYTVSGSRSFAAGNGTTDVTVDENQCFVWTDNYTSQHYDNSPTTSQQFMVRAYNGAYFSDEMSGEKLIDGTDYPEDLETAYAAVLSMNRLPDGEYDSSDCSVQLDHATLTDFVISENYYKDGIARNLSATVSAQNEVIKDLIATLTQLEQEAMMLQAALGR